MNDITLGPWHACRDGECKCGMIYGADGNTLVAIAQGEMYLNDFVGPDEVPDKKRQAANAKLIASAPDLQTQIIQITNDLELADAEIKRLREEVQRLREGSAPVSVLHWLDVVTKAILETQEQHHPTVGIAATALVDWMLEQQEGTDAK